MQIEKEYFKESFVRDLFNLSRVEFDHLFETADRTLKVRLMMLEVWGQILIEGMTVPDVSQGLTKQVSF